jgi:hypothetical protein
VVNVSSSPKGIKIRGGSGCAMANRFGVWTEDEGQKTENMEEKRDEWDMEWKIG